MAKGKGTDFFTQMKKQYGENFLNFLDSRTLNNKCLQIFRQMSRGQIDVVENGKYFLEPQLMEACLKSVNTKITLHSISMNGVGILQNSIINNGMQVDPNIVAVLDYHTRSFEAYNLIYNILLQVNSTSDISSLLILSSKLQEYRNYI